MTKMRLFEYGAKVGHTPEELREVLVKLGKPAKSNLSLLEGPQIEALNAHFSGTPVAPKKPAVKPAPAGVPAGAAGSAAVVPGTAVAVAKPVLRAVSGIGVRVAPPKPVKKSDIPPPAPKAEEPKAESGAAAEAKPKEAPSGPSAPLTTVITSLPPRPKPAPRQLTSVSMEIPKFERKPEPPKPEKKAAAAPEVYIPPAPAAGSTRPGQPGQNSLKKDKRKKKDKETELEDKLFAKEAAKIAAAAALLIPVGDVPKILKLPEGVSVSELAQAMQIKATDIIKKLMMDYKVMATVNQKLNKDVVETLAIDFGFEIQHEGLYGVDLLDQEESDKPENVVPRAPVVTIMGHVDHGKTSLLDAIRDSAVAAGEHGGITQHIGAYKVHLAEHDGFHGGDVVFLDTPGHAAFTAMRARGAAATDIVVLVVAADDSVMPQTIEAIAHAKEAKVPIVVAINKIDKEGANPDKVMQELAVHGLNPEAWGGETAMVKISAKKRQGVKELLELLVLQADILELKADPKRRAKGVVIEAKLDKGRGAVSTVLVQKGTLRVGDMLVMGNHFGRVRALHDDKGVKIDEAGPSTPVEVLGMSGVPEAGDNFQSVENEKLARQISVKRMQVQTDRERAERGHVKLENLFDRIEAGDVKELKIVIKADVSGSAEALKATLEDIKSDKVRARVIQAGVGNINESDILLAAASDAIIIGFHVKAVGQAVELAHREKVEIRSYQVIYEAVTDVRDAMTGLLEPHYRETVTGKGEVRQIFKISKGLFVGSMITSGKITRDATIRIFRGEEKLWEGKINSLKRFKDDAKEVVEGMECGIGVDPAAKAEVGDTFEVLVQEEVAQKL